jgi:hypothetical protein
MGGWMYVWMVRWKDGLMDGWMSGGLVDRWMGNGLVDGWMVGRIDRWMD